MGGTFGNFYDGGDQSNFLGGGMVGGKQIVRSFFSLLQNFADFFAIFIILSPQFEIFMGVPSHCKPLKIFMMGGHFKVHDGGTPHHPPCAHLCCGM